VVAGDERRPHVGRAAGIAGHLEALAERGGTGELDGDAGDAQHVVFDARVAYARERIPRTGRAAEADPVAVRGAHRVDSELIAKTLDGLDVIPPTSSGSTAKARRDTRRERLDEPER
jgi:hypothetical protein